MKKTLFMCALGLTIATSMVAGTMAIYTHQDELLNDSGYQAMAKTFYINANSKAEIENMKLAPGESGTWGFEVTNKDANGNISEVDTDVIVSVEFGKQTNWQDFAVSLIDQNGNVIAEERPTNGKAEFIDPALYKANTERTEAYTLEFKWLDKDAQKNDISETLTDEQDTELVLDENGNIKSNDLPVFEGIKVTVTGNQHV